MQDRFLGVTVLGDFILSEGIAPVLQRILGCGANAVATNPTVTAPAEGEGGSLQPPDDAGSSPRLFDRPLWGRRSLRVRSACSFEPDPSLYCGAYRPRRADDLTRRQGAEIGRFIREARRCGLKVYLQIGAAEPPGLREADLPLLPDGALPGRRVANTGSLFSSEVRRYNQAYARDLLRVYPEIDGLRLDWPEYPCYTPDEAAADWSSHAEAAARREGIDWNAVKQECGACLLKLRGGLRNEDLAALLEEPDGEAARNRLIRGEALQSWLQLKRRASNEIRRCWREAVDEAGRPDIEVSFNAFPAPWNRITGFDYAWEGAGAGASAVKLYTMHWIQMARFWMERLAAENRELDEALLIQVIYRLFDLEEEETPLPTCLSQVRYPAPDEPHPVSSALQQRRLRQAREAAAPERSLLALVHAYGPPSDFRRRFRLAWRSPDVDGVWINRYGYLSDEKLKLLADEAAAGPPRSAPL